MIVTYNWLKEFVDIDINVNELAERLTSIGPEVVSVKKAGIGNENASFVLLAKVIDIDSHPKADNLKICKLNAKGSNYQVVTNSRTIEKGCFAVLALPGAVLPDGTEIKPAIIREVKQ